MQNSDASRVCAQTRHASGFCILSQGGLEYTHSRHREMVGPFNIIEARHIVTSAIRQSNVCLIVYILTSVGMLAKAGIAIQVWETSCSSVCHVHCYFGEVQTCSVWISTRESDWRVVDHIVGGYAVWFPHRKWKNRALTLFIMQNKVNTSKSRTGMEIDSTNVLLSPKVLCLVGETSLESDPWSKWNSANIGDLNWWHTVSSSIPSYSPASSSSLSFSLAGEVQHWRVSLGPPQRPDW